MGPKKCLDAYDCKRFSNIPPALIKRQMKTNFSLIKRKYLIFVNFRLHFSRTHYNT